MGNLIDISYFFSGRFTIPHVTHNENVQQLVTKLISDYEPEYMHHMFGDSFTDWLKTNTSDALMTGVQTTSTLFSEDEEKKKLYFTGLIDKRGVVPLSPIAMYVYLQWLEQTEAQTTLHGAVALQHDNAQRVNQSAKKEQVLSTFIDNNNRMMCYILNEKSKPGYDGGYKYYVGSSKSFIDTKNKYLQW